MDLFRILWDEPDDPDGNVQHIADHGLNVEDVEEVLSNPSSEGTSKTTGRPCAWGYTLEGLYIIVVYEQIDADTISRRDGLRGARTNQVTHEEEVRTCLSRTTLNAG